MLYKYLCRNCLELIRIVSNLFTYSNFTFYLLLYFTCVFHSSSLIMSISFRSFTDRWPGVPWEINPINDLLITILESAYVAIGNLYKPEAVRQKKNTQKTLQIAHIFYLQYPFCSDNICPCFVLILSSLYIKNFFQVKTHMRYWQFFLAIFAIWIMVTFRWLNTISDMLPVRIFWVIWQEIVIYFNISVSHRSTEPISKQ